MSEIMTQLAERLFRLKRPLGNPSKAELAEKLGVSRSTLHRYETNPEQMSGDFVRALRHLEAKAFGESETTEESGSVREEMIPYGQRLPYTPEVDVTRGLASFLLEQLGRSEAFALASELVKQAEQGDSSAGKKARLILELLEE